MKLFSTSFFHYLRTGGYVSFLMLITLCLMFISHHSRSSSASYEATVLSSSIIPLKTSKILFQLHSFPADSAALPSPQLRVHIIDQTLDYYAVIKPSPNKKPGQYYVTFTPDSASVRVWLEIVAGDSSHYIKLLPTNPSAQEPSHSVMQTVKSSPIPCGKYLCSLRFDGQMPSVGETIIAKLRVTNPEGLPIQAFAPFDQIYATGIAFMEGGNTLIPVATLGKKPLSLADKGGPDLYFQLTPIRTGYLKIFIQLKVGATPETLGFGIWVP